MLILKVIFIFFQKRGNEENQSQGDDEYKRRCTIVHCEQITHFQISMITQQGSELGQRKCERKQGERKCQNQSKNVAKEKISVVHMREKEGDTHSKEEGGTQNRFII